MTGFGMPKIKPTLPSIGKPKEEDGKMIRGIDISHYEPLSADTLKQVAAAGYAFCFTKGTDGTAYVDPTCEKHLAGAKSAGMVNGAYHFLRFSYSGKDQAEHFTRHCKDADILILDCEWDNKGDGRYHDGGKMDDHAATVALDFLEAVEKYAGRTPLLYTSPGFFYGFSNPERFAKYPLWVAHYNVTTPKLPKPWTTYAFHQYTDKEPIPGGATVDASRFNGDLAALKAMVGK